MTAKQIVNLNHLNHYLKESKGSKAEGRVTFTLKKEYIGYLGIHPIESIVITDDLVKIFAWEFHNDFEIVEIDRQQCIVGTADSPQFLTIIKKEILEEYSVV